MQRLSVGEATLLAGDDAVEVELDFAGDDAADAFDETAGLVVFLAKAEGVFLGLKVDRPLSLSYVDCAVNLTPRARITLRTVSKRGLAPGISAL